MKRKLLMFAAIPLGTAGAMLGAAHFGQVWIAMAVPIVLVIALVVIPGFTIPEDYLARWTKAHGLTITDSNRDLIRRYLLHGRRIRTAGGLAGYVGYSVYTMVTFDEPPFSWIVAVFAGYLLGAAAAEVWALRPQPGSVRAASLKPRTLTDYVPRYAVIGLRLVPVVTLIVTLSWPLLPKRANPVLSNPSRYPTALHPNIGAVIGWTVASVVLALFIEVTARRIVRRPQPATSEELVIVDDAIRSTALHGLFGAGLALLLGAFARNASQLNWAIDDEWLRGTLWTMMVLGFVASPFAWLHLGIDQPWVVRRSRNSEPVAA